MCRAIIVTSVLFGLTHLANVLAGVTVLETISQSPTIAFGVAFAALVLRTGIIWLPGTRARSHRGLFPQVPGFAFSTTWTLIINLVWSSLRWLRIVVMRRDPGLVATERT